MEANNTGLGKRDRLPMGCMVYMEEGLAEILPSSPRGWGKDRSGQDDKKQAKKCPRQPQRTRRQLDFFPITSLLDRFKPMDNFFFFYKCVHECSYQYFMYF